MKFTVKVTDFRPFRRNTLRGFATVHVDEHLTLHDIAVHQHDSGARWVGLPATSSAPPTARSNMCGCLRSMLAPSAMPFRPR